MRRSFDSDEAHWYALDVARQKEYLAGYFFQRAGCVTFIPSETRFRKRNRYVKSNVKIEVAYPAVPGVIFVGFPGAPNWFRIMGMHLVNGVLSIDGHPHRIDTANPEWITYRGRQLDGSMIVEKQRVTYRGEVVDRSARLIQMQGRGVLRSPLSIKAKAAADRPVVIRVAGERARAIGALLGGVQLRSEAA